MSEATFHMRRAKPDRSGYYVTRWDRAVNMAVIASNEDEAISKASTLSGTAPDGKYWTFIVDKIEENRA